MIILMMPFIVICTVGIIGDILLSFGYDASDYNDTPYADYLLINPNETGPDYSIYNFNNYADKTSL